MRAVVYEGAEKVAIEEVGGRPYRGAHRRLDAGHF